jgi:glycolate oxidase iron-sulfur subunit
VQYRDLISPFRALAESQRDRPLIERIRRWLLLQTLPKSELFRIVAMLGVMVRPFRKLIPGPLRAMLELMPAALPKSEALLDHYIPLNKPSARVALLAGCAQQVLAPEINKATIDVLVSNGVEVIVPRRQSCCGALAWHVGEAAMAAECAKENLWAFPDDVDAILTNAAGCGSCLHEYPLILRGTKHEENARRFASRSIDASRYICGLNLNAPIGFDHPVSVVMQDACHLLHGQNVRDEPRRLIAQVPNVTLHEIADAEICCGSAGTYNLDHPDTAAELGRRKARQIIASGAEIVLSGNIGCLTQLQAHLSALKSEITVMHTIVFLRAAYEGRLPQGV